VAILLVFEATPKIKINPCKSLILMVVTLLKGSGIYDLTI
jgi:hypothetical protein